MLVVPEMSVSCDDCCWGADCGPYPFWAITYPRREWRWRRNVSGQGPSPNSVKAVQRFLGFANYFRRFIRGFSTVITPLTSLLRGGPQRLLWMADAEMAFETLKARFTTAPVLAHPY
nr:uncharacterized protein LOC111960262 [Salvelinus alpinus]